MPKVKSSYVSAVEHNALSGELQVTFKNGRTYRYEGVPREKYERLVGAESVGRMFREEIEGQYAFLGRAD